MKQNKNINLNRFLEAQKDMYDIALKEVKSGRKISHWIWFIYPQIYGFGISETSQEYGIKNLKEASAYLKHPILGFRLREITGELIELEENDPEIIFGEVDSRKVHSSLTLFSLIERGEHNIFKDGLKKFFNGRRNYQTLVLIILPFTLRRWILKLYNRYSSNFFWYQIKKYFNVH